MAYVWHKTRQRGFLGVVLQWPFAWCKPMCVVGSSLVPASGRLHGGALVETNSAFRMKWTMFNTPQSLPWLYVLLKASSRMYMYMYSRAMYTVGSAHPVQMNNFTEVI